VAGSDGGDGSGGGGGGGGGGGNGHGGAADAEVSDDDASIISGSTYDATSSYATSNFSSAWDQRQSDEGRTPRVPPPVDGSGAGGGGGGGGGEGGSPPPDETKMGVALDQVQRCLSGVPSVARAVAFSSPGAVYGDDVYCVVTPVRLTGGAANDVGRVAVIAEDDLKRTAQASLPQPILPVRFYMWRKCRRM